MNKMFTTRTVGETGISIGTHLMLESLFHKNMLELYDKDREFEKLDPSKFDYHVYNIFTIIRNIVNSVTETRVVEDILQHKDFITVLKIELKLLSDMYKSIRCKPRLFYPDYDKIYKKYNMGKETAITKVYTEHMMFKSILDKLEREEKIVSINNNKGYTFPPFPKEQGQKDNPRIIITTNIPVDLFNLNSKIELLESHTGKLKSVSEFNSKYHPIGQQDLSHLPWVEEILYILGDKTIVLPMKLNIRRELLQLSKDFNWTVKTTREKVLSNLKTHKDFSIILKSFSKLY